MYLVLKFKTSAIDLILPIRVGCLWFISCVKFTYSEKATQFCNISTVDLSYVTPVKSMVQNFVAFSEYMNFIKTYETKTNMCLRN